MTNINGKSIFDLALLQVEREGKLNNNDVFNLVLDRAIKIRKYFDIQERNKKVALSRWSK